jgi:methanethiol S-methyltransferase
MHWLLPTSDDCVIVASWVGFGVFHSLFANEAVKNTVLRLLPPAASKLYRAAYNLASVGLTLWIGGVSTWDVPHADAVILHTGGEKMVCDTIGVAAVLGFLSVCRAYDMMYFFGVKSEPSKPLGWSFLHRFVRHPWYTCSLLFLWSRNMDRSKLVSTIMMSLYFFIGSQFEERRLKNMPGGAGLRYQRYCSLVPGIIPNPLKWLTEKEIANVLSVPSTLQPK